LEEHTASTFIKTGFVWADAKKIQRKNFVSYVEQFEIVWPITAMKVGGGERIVLIQWDFRFQQ
jgi:hypothetical protein